LSFGLVAPQKPLVAAHIIFYFLLSHLLGKNLLRGGKEQSEQEKAGKKLYAGNHSSIGKNKFNITSYGVSKLFMDGNWGDLGGRRWWLFCERRR